MKKLYRQLLRYWLAIVVAIMTGVLSFFSFFWQLDLLVYDWQARKFNYELDDRIVIVSIDERSLERFGQWPWERKLMASALENITNQNPAAIGLDVMYSKKGDSEQDQQLAKVIKNNNNIILPVLYEQYDHKGQLVEVLPDEIFITQDTKLGHVSKSLDKDGIVRRAFLKSGLSSAYWSSMSWQLVETALDSKMRMPGVRNQNESHSLFSWVMDYMIYIPFVGPPSAIPYLSIADVVDNNISSQQFKDKVVLIGATASGLGDVLITPLTAERNPMPGVEVIANEVNGLLTGTSIIPIKESVQIFINVIIVFLVMLLYPLMTPRNALFLNLFAIAYVFIMSIVLLRNTSLWMPPSIMILMIQVGYILWSWQRLTSIVRLLNNELEILTHEPHQIIDPRSDLLLGIKFLKGILPNTSGRLIGPRNKELYSWGINEYEVLVEQGVAEYKNKKNDYKGIINFKDQSYVLEIENSDRSKYDIKKITHQIFFDEQKAKQNYAVYGEDVIGEKLDKVRRAYEEIRLYRRFTNHILTELQTGFIATDSKSQILMANPQAKNMLGGTDEIMNRSLLLVLSRLKRTDRKKWDCVLVKLILEGEDIQVEAVNKEGKDMLVFISLYHQSDNKYGYLVSLLDISNIKNIQRQRREMMSFMTHDLRSPLVSILSSCELSKIMPEKYLNKDFVKGIETNTRKTLQYAEDLLYINHAENIEEESKAFINVYDLIYESVDQVQKFADTKYIDITISSNDKEIFLFCHGMMLGRAIVNLVINAIKYSPNNSAITIDVNKYEKYIQINIKDQGYGILEKDIESIFKRFVRVTRRDHEDEKGSGLGLAFVQTVIEKHQGSIHVESKINQGTEFTITFPYAEDNN